MSGYPCGCTAFEKCGSCRRYLAGQYEWLEDCPDVSLGIQNSDD